MSTDLVKIISNGEVFLISRSSVSSVFYDSNDECTVIILKERRKRYEGEEPFNQVIRLSLSVEEVIKQLID
jgi:uncharacterized phage-like protein YoqJ